MQIFLALFFLGLLQGLTEFLPVSSSGHLVLFSKIFGIEESLFVSIMLHIATLLSVLVVLRKEVWQLIRHPLSEQSIKLVVATIPTCAIVLLLMPIIKSAFGGSLLPFCFLISAIILVVAQKSTNQKPLTYKTAFLMGVAQGFAVFPGISRSGSTIGTGLLTGADQKETTKFSFLMSIPIIFASLFMEIFEILTQKQTISVPALPMIFSFLTAFLVGIFAIKFMIKITSKKNLKYFSIYLLLLAVATLFLM